MILRIQTYLADLPALARILPAESIFEVKQSYYPRQREHAGIRVLALLDDEQFAACRKPLRDWQALRPFTETSSVECFRERLVSPDPLMSEGQVAACYRQQFVAAHQEEHWQEGDVMDLLYIKGVGTVLWNAMGQHGISLETGMERRMEEES
jgi:hypothetical protein